MTEPDKQHSRMSAMATPYIGRFAPSPSGPLHMGSLVAALASYLDARSHNGKWLMRMEDLDPPRESAEAADQILHALDALGLHWDGPVLYQSQRYPAYAEAIATLQEKHMVFACDCTRQQILDNDGVYPGTCRERGLADGQDMALRCRVSDRVLTFDDAIQGRQQQQLESAVGDFVIRRKDGLYAYQLAVVVDDGFQNITHVVRGIDLLDSTPRQITLQELLNLPRPHYSHIPVIVNRDGQKLSKQHHATAIDTSRPAQLLVEALTYLQQQPDPHLLTATPADILAWGTTHWQPEALSALATLPEVTAD